MLSLLFPRPRPRRCKDRCVECASATACKRCAFGFGLVDGRCSRCADERCRACDGDTACCTRCAPEDEWRTTSGGNCVEWKFFYDLE